jgi:hypothetical protein
LRDHDFHLEVAYALTSCQLIEQELKLYTSEAFQLAAKCVGHRMVFKFSGDDYEDASLERLIAAFRKLSKNIQLIADLEKFKKDRNFLSHKSITHCLDRDEELSLTEVGEIQPMLKNIQKDALKLREAINDEANLFRGHLWFEELDANDRGCVETLIILVAYVISLRRSRSD